MTAEAEPKKPNSIGKKLLLWSKIVLNCLLIYQLLNVGTWLKDKISKVNLETPKLYSIFAGWFLVSFIVCQILISFCVSHAVNFYNVRLERSEIRKRIYYGILIITIVYTILFVWVSYPYISNGVRFINNWFFHPN